MNNLRRINWREEFKSGNASEDQDRKELLYTYNKFIDCENQENKLGNFLDYLNKVIEVSQVHFHNEEKFINKYSTLSLDIHKALHESFLYELEQSRTELMEGKLVNEDEVVGFIKTWWTIHSSGHDFFYNKKIKVSKKKRELEFV